MKFTEAKDTYRQNAVAQKFMAKKLMRFLKETSRADFDNILEIGAGTGFLTDEITENLTYKKLFLNDLTPNYTNIVPHKYIEGDITKAEIPAELDLIISNAVFQWLDEFSCDFDNLFLKMSKSLGEKGILAFSTFGNENFKQIKDITGFGLNYPDFKKILKSFGYEILAFEEELQTLYFEDAKKVLEHIKTTGVTTFKGSMWTVRKFQEFKNEYIKKFSDSNGCELTYHPVYFIAKLQK